MRIQKIFATAVAVLGVALLVPWRDNPTQYLHWRDRIRTVPLINAFLGDPCATYEDNAIMYDPGPNCYRYGPQQVISGIWVYEFEGATFIERAKMAPKTPAVESSWRVSVEYLSRSIRAWTRLR